MLIKSQSLFSPISRGGIKQVFQKSSRHSAKSTFPSPSVSLRSEEILVSIENLCLTSGFSILWKCFRKREISVSPVSSSEFYLCE
ncbi:hypothetical protein CEXT_459451 [Caerostris extrusa]|uniref:Uncharacterized protein n=1 Tax=Caerostris extrusa TaxID=172846 RepID=A0AAV4TZR9_CAEEX|nr:hypothetical protein CEXT_459451 [Caerostris extrusa]